MEATQDTGADKAPMREDIQAGPTAKEMAAVEEINSARIKAQIAREQALAESSARVEPTIIEVAAQGMDALHAALQARSQEAPPPYVPPPRTERQMTQLQEELEAGRKAQQRAEAQQLSRPAAPTDLNKEGFTTPVYRPDNMVPDPITGKLGAITGK